MNVPGVGQRSIVLLDVDGTLVESNDLHARAWAEAFDEAGMPLPFSRIRKLIGMGADALLPALGVGLTVDSEPGRDIAKRRAEIFSRRYIDRVRAARGARRLLDALGHGGAIRIVATSAKPDELQTILRLCGLDGAIDDAATAADAARSKPAPDILLAALAKAGGTPADAVMIGDTRFDIDAARAAGIAAIALRCGETPDAELSGAAYVFDDPHELAIAIEAGDVVPT